MKLKVDLLKRGIENDLPVRANISIENENGNSIGVFAHKANISIENKNENNIDVFAHRAFISIENKMLNKREYAVGVSQQ